MIETTRDITVRACRREGWSKEKIEVFLAYVANVWAWNLDAEFCVLGNSLACAMRGFDVNVWKGEQPT